MISTWVMWKSDFHMAKNLSNSSSLKMISSWVMWKSDFHMAHVEIWFLFTSATDDFTNFLKMYGNFSMAINNSNSYRNNYFLSSLCTLGLLLVGTKNIWPFGPFTIWWAIWGEFKFATLAVLLGILFPSFPALTVRIWPFCVWDGGEIGVELLTILCPMTFPFLSKTFSILAPAL